MSTIWVKFVDTFVPKHDIRSVRIGKSDEECRMMIRTSSGGASYIENQTIPSELFDKHRNTFENRPWWEWPCVEFYSEPPNNCDVRPSEIENFDHTRLPRLLPSKYEVKDEYGDIFTATGEYAKCINRMRFKSAFEFGEPHSM